MKASEINKYLPYADENVDLVVISRKEYEKLVRKARKLELIRKLVEGKLYHYEKVLGDC